MKECAIDSSQMCKSLKSSVLLEIISDVDPSLAEMDDDHHLSASSWAIVSDIAPSSVEKD